MTATQFLDLLAQRDLVAPEVIQSLRQQMARARYAIPPVAFANLLIDRGHLTFYQGMKLLGTGAAVEALEEVDSQRMRRAALGDASPGGPAGASGEAQQNAPLEVPQAQRSSAQRPPVRRSNTEDQSLELHPLEEESPRTKPAPSTTPAVTFFVEGPPATAAAGPVEPSAAKAADEGSRPPLQSQPSQGCPQLPPLADETEDLERMGQVVNSPTHRGVRLPPIEWRKRSLLERLGFGKK